MPHLVFVALSGFRVREERLRELGMTLPGFQQRAAAIGQLPALGLLTLAGMLPKSWTSEYHCPAHVTLELIEQIAPRGQHLSRSPRSQHRFTKRTRSARRCERVVSE